MTLSLAKGEKVSLSKAEPGLSRILIGLGWDVRTTDGADFDLDSSVLLLGDNGKVPSDREFIFYNQPQSADGSVVHQGDNRTGAGDGDDEVVTADLSKLPANIQKVAIVVSIHDAEGRSQNFGQVRNAYVRIVNLDNDHEIARYDLTEEFSTETALIFADVYRHNGEWKFGAVGQGYSSGLAGVASDFGVNV